MPDRPSQPPAPPALILTAPGISYAPTVAALAAQSTEPHEVMIGGIDDALGLDHRWVWLLDAGVRPEPSALAALLDARGRLPSAALLAGQVLTERGALDRASMPVIAVHDRTRVLAALEQRLVPLIAARQGSLLVRTSDLAGLSGPGGALRWSALLLRRELGALVPESVGVRTAAAQNRRSAPGRMWAAALALAAVEKRDRVWFAADLVERGLGRHPQPVPDAACHGGDAGEGLGAAEVGDRGGGERP